MAVLYRLLTEEDGSAFCHKVSEALAKGWSLYGGPTYAFDHERKIMMCGQAVTKEIPGEYTPDMKLGAQ
ncbi:MAG: DUF1737 domain-containing protein [Pseudomonadota bacterium]